MLVHPPLRTLALLAGFQAALPSSADPLHGISLRGDEPSLGAPGDDELPCPATARDAVHHDSLASGVVLIHQAHELLDLRIRRHAVVGYVDVIVVELARHILAIVELATIHDRSDVLFVVNIENIRIRPPRCRDDAFDNPGEGFSSFRLSSCGPIPWADCLTHILPILLHSHDSYFKAYDKAVAPRNAAWVCVNPIKSVTLPSPISL